MKNNLAKIFTLFVALLCVTALAACGSDGGTTITPPVHTHDFENYKPNGNATCTEDGTETAKCGGCDENRTQPEAGSALGHNFTNYVIINVPTCAEDATTIAVCDRCGVSNTEKQPGSALGHNYTKIAYDETNHWTECTRCTDKINTETHIIGENNMCSCGYGCDHEEGTAATCTTQAICSKCANPYGALADHTPQVLEAKVPSCTDSGLTVGLKCSICNITIEAQTPIDPLGHSFANYVSDENSTVSEDGTKTAVCDRDQCNVISTVANEGTAWLKFTLNSDNTYSVTGYSDEIGADVSIPAEYNGLPVAYIESEAFYCCVEIKNLTIPESIKLIGDAAFRGCIGLTSITISSNALETIGDYAFVNCKSLKSITIPNSAIYIGKESFKYCSSLETLSLPFVGSSRINHYVGFRNQYFYHIFGEKSATYPEEPIPESLKTVIITDDTEISQNAFAGCGTIENIIISGNITNIATGAFAYCSGLKSITLPFVGGSSNIDADANIYPFGYIFGELNYTGCTETKQRYYDPNEATYAQKTYYIPTSLESVTITGGSVSPAAFENCKGLKNITLNNNLTSLGGSAFSNCTGLTSITIPNSVTSIGNGVFSGCTGLTSITIPNSVTSIGDKAFSGCTSLVNIEMSNNLTNLGRSIFKDCTCLQYNEFDNAYYLGNENNPYVILMKAKDTYITSCEINSNTKVIYDEAFMDCVEITSIIIPDKVTVISMSAFFYCTKLENVTLSDNLISIGRSAFYNCTALTSVTIGNSVTLISNSAFGNCDNMTSVTFENTSDWWVSTDSTATSGTSVDVTDVATNAINLTSTYQSYHWKRSE